MLEIEFDERLENDRSTGTARRAKSGSPRNPAAFISATTARRGATRATAASCSPPSPACLAAGRRAGFSCSLGRSGRSAGTRARHARRAGAGGCAALPAAARTRGRRTPGSSSLRRAPTDLHGLHAHTTPSGTVRWRFGNALQHLAHVLDPDRQRDAPPVWFLPSVLGWSKPIQAIADQRRAGSRRTSRRRNRWWCRSCRRGRAGPSFAALAAVP